jgi:protoporphyrinogen/coproporphyrinogen III oxidase
MIMTNRETDIIIIGAGITGLTLGYWLKKAGKHVVLLEKNERAGGVINSFHENGFLYETGPNTGIIANEHIVRLFESLGERITVETPNEFSKRRLILKKGRWTPLPSGIFDGIRTPLFTFRDKLRILGEPFRKRGDDPEETVSALVIRRLGRSYLDYAVDPFISGIYAGNPHALVTRHALPKLYALEQKYGSFIRGAVIMGMDKKKGLQNKVTKEIFSVRGGLKKLVNALAEETGYGNIELNCRELRVVCRNGGFTCSYRSAGNNNYISAGTVISTVNPCYMKSIFPFIPKSLAAKISAIEYAGVIQVVACFRKWNGINLNAFGGLMPSRENTGVLGILFPSSIFDGRAPANGAVLSVFMGGSRNPALMLKSEAELEDIATSQIRMRLKSYDKPDILKVFRYEKAIPQYGKNTTSAIQAIENVENDYPGFLIAGNIRDGIGIADRVKQALDTADKIVNSRCYEKSIAAGKYRFA